MKNLVPVSEIMSIGLQTVAPDRKIIEIKKIFDENRFRHLPVVENGKVIGMISKTDLMRITYGAMLSEGESQQVNDYIYHTLEVEEVMTKMPICIPSNTTVREAAIILKNNMISALPVVDNGELKGLVTTIDLLEYLVTTENELVSYR